MKASIDWQHSFIFPPDKGKREDIQGIRAIAIVSVLLYHFLPKRFPNGLLGVDMFFVVSGYLMSFVLSKHKTTTIRNSMDFYARRIKRITPLYFLVLFVTAFSSMFLMSYSWLVDNFDRMSRAVVFLTNVDEINSTRHYANQIAKDSHTLYLHTWSLSIEMQFYLVVPLLFFLMKNIFKANRILCVLLSVIIASASLSYSLALYRNQKKQRHFYHPLSRGWQFFIGILAHIMSDKSTTANKGGSLLIKLSGSGGLVVLSSFSLIFLPTNLDQQNLRMFITLMTGVLLYFGAYCINLVLANRLLCYIGDLSYALYIVHWPVLNLFKYYGHWHNVGEHTCLVGAAITVVTISVLLHHLYEKRLVMMVNSYSHISTIFFGTCCLLLLFSWERIEDRLLGPYSTVIKENLKYRHTQLAYPNEANYTTSFGGFDLDYPEQLAEFPGGTGKPKIFVVGNSYAGQQLRVFRRIMKPEEYSKLWLYWTQGNEVLHSTKPNVIDITREMVKTLRPEIMIISVRYVQEKAPIRDWPDRITEIFKENLRFYEQYVDHILVESPHPLYPLEFMNNFLEKLQRGIDVSDMHPNLTVSHGARAIQFTAILI